MGESLMLMMTDAFMEMTQEIIVKLAQHEASPI
jgi:hypothetical protein